MENQGYEDEHPRGADPTASVPNVYSDSHFYEDIAVNEVPDAATEKPNDVPRGSCETSRRSSVSEDEELTSNGFHRNLTLPFRRATCPDVLASSSVRLTSREKKNVRQDVPESVPDTSPESTSLREAVLDRTDLETVGLHSRHDDRPARRRRKKDCKHCRVKTATKDETVPRHQAACPAENETPLNVREGTVHGRSRPENGGMSFKSSYAEDTERRIDESNAETIIARGFGILPVCRATGKTPAVFSITENAGGFGRFVENGVADDIGKGIGTRRIGHKGQERKEAVAKKRAGMRVNSIYSQERWYAKEAPIFFTDVEKEHGPFQRAYSLPVRTQTPSSQNRANLRRSVRGEPPPHPARLRKHRHGWTLHLARPLEAPGCTRPLVFLLIVVLALLAVGAAALYIVFEPEKLQIIQQYLRSTTSNSTRRAHEETLPATSMTDERNDTSTVSLTNDTLIRGPDSNGSVSERETETEDASGNATRYCDDCLSGEVCVALVGEDVPICRLGLDHEDPTGCAGHCLINKQKCHRLDVDAFRCVEVEHYCLDDEWTCSNTLCIPLDKHCDGHMNCYDHSDEYNCACNPETHFQCGNETSCLPLEKRCDGKIDCWDAADEINCTLACPLENEFTCSNGQCILRARFCDGLPDCVDGSDEPHGCQGRCNKHEFTCQNSRCIAKGVKCNGIDDCGDGTDERHCKERFT